jgi:hypothetical protein
MNFPIRARDHADTDDMFKEELRDAGIPMISAYIDNLISSPVGSAQKVSSEVKTPVRGHLHGWNFERNREYWVAEALHTTHGKDVHVYGRDSCPSPGDVCKGLACDCYHVHSPEGLKALADTIKAVVDKYEARVA